MIICLRILPKRIFRQKHLFYTQIHFAEGITVVDYFSLCNQLVSYRMVLADIHCHALWGVDDGARSSDETHAMIKALYDEGVRTICFTPHYNPRLFRPEPEAEERHFSDTVLWAKEVYPDLKLYLGAEYFAYRGGVEKFVSGECRTLGGTNRILTEFYPTEDPSVIRSSVAELLSAGYRPLIAHVERYEKLSEKDIAELRDMGASVQVNATSVTGENGVRTKLKVMKLIKHGLVDVVADDCHRIDRHKPGLAAAYAAVCRKFGESTAQKLFYKNPISILTK